MNDAADDVKGQVIKTNLRDADGFGTDAWDCVVAERSDRPREGCIVLPRQGDQIPAMPSSFRAAALGTKTWCQSWLDENARSHISLRQCLFIQQRELAALTQALLDSDGSERRYDVPYGLTPDEAPTNEGLPRFAGAYHKLLEHDERTGLLTEQLSDCGLNSGVENYERLLDGLNVSLPSSDFDSEELENLELCRPRSGRPRVLINPRSSKALSIKGPDIASFRVSQLLWGQENERALLEQLSLASPYTAAEMVEVYAMSLLRPLLLGNYRGSADAEVAIKAVNSFGEFFVWGYEAAGKPINAVNRPVTVENLFRGPTPGDLAGDYLSVFLTFLRAPIFPSGCAPFVADLIEAGKFADRLGEELRVPLGPDRYFLLTRREYVAVQNGEIPRPYPDGFFRGLTPIQTGLDLGNYVHVDNVYEHVIRAADILVAGQYDRSPLSPYTRGGEPSYENEADGPTLGPSDAYALIGGVREVAERAAFAQKWLVARRARPEVLSGLVDLGLRRDVLDGSLAEIQATVRGALQSWPRPSGGGEGAEERLGAVERLLKRIAAQNLRQQSLARLPQEKNYLLAQMYPEGSPAHPAWPSGHATVVGAGVTVLKAIFDDRQCILDPSSPVRGRASCDTQRTCYQPSSAKRALSVGGELDKLASNIAFGRNFGGVHYRSDGEHGILLGEEVAVRYLQDHLREYREEFRSCSTSDEPNLRLTRRNGQRICITPDRVFEVPSTRPAATPGVFHKSTL